MYYHVLLTIGLESFVVKLMKSRQPWAGWPFELFCSYTWPWKESNSVTDHGQLVIRS